MDRLLYIGSSGLSQIERAQASNANNLANANTAAFRGDFHRVMAQQIDGPGMPTRVNAMSAGTYSDMTVGPTTITGRDLDVAIQGEGWFAVQANDGSEAYSRRGDFQLNSDGLLMNGAGQLVMGDGGPVAIPENESLSIGADGTVSIVPLGQGPESLVIVDRIRLVKADDAAMFKREDGLMGLREGEAAVDSADVRLSPKSLEGSNINTVDAMVSMIALARQFEMQVKVMSTADTLAESGSRLLRME